MTDAQIKHLEFLQNIITRMNTNSFQIKTFAITVLAALLAVYASTKDAVFFIVPMYSSFLFGLLDAFYLQQERKFRGIYNAILTNKGIKIEPFEMPLGKFTGGQYHYWNVVTSKTILYFYGGIIALLSMLLIIMPPLFV